MSWFMGGSTKLKAKNVRKFRLKRNKSVIGQKAVVVSRKEKKKIKVGADRTCDRTARTKLRRRIAKKAATRCCWPKKTERNF